MESSSAVAGPMPASPAQSVSGTGTPWYCRVVVLAAAFILVGIVWDISWHSGIGRDTFWTPAHICIHLGGTLGGLVCGWLVLKSTFAPEAADRLNGVRVWGFRGPFGAWVTIWGALAMLTSAPFDNWWHNAYGLDVQILSPPHSVLAAGMYFHVVGGLLLVLSVQNRSAEASGTQGRWLFAFAGGILVCLAAIMATERSLPNQQHGALFYKIGCGLFPFFLASLGRASRLTWPATAVAGIYLALMCAAVWVLPLFPAHAKLAPIFNPIHHMVPPAFPLLLVVPACGMDVVSRIVGRGRGWKRDLLATPLLATAFTALFLLTQWRFSAFLISAEAENRLFAGSGFFSFADVPNESWHRFWDAQTHPLDAKAIFIAWLLALGSTAAGLAVGGWMAKVRR